MPGQRLHLCQGIRRVTGHHLALALEALGVGPGDEVLVPALTWPSPAHAVRGVAATVKLVDVDPHEWNSTPEAFAAARSSRTRAAIVIDQFGNPARAPELHAVLEPRRRELLQLPPTQGHHHRRGRHVPHR